MKMKRSMRISSAMTAAVLMVPALVTASGQGQSGPDVSGRWNRDSGMGLWGPRAEITQTATGITVRPESGEPVRYRLDGKETAEVISVKGCANKTRITKAAINRDRLTITTWVVTKSFCVHGEDEDDPLVSQLGAVDVEQVRGTRILESITDVYREGNALTAETTRRQDGSTTHTTTTYRK